MTQYPLPHDSALSFMFAGNATVTFENPETGNRFTYRIHLSDDRRVSFVGLLRGPNNDNDFTYIGCVNTTPNATLRRTARSKVGSDAPSFRAFRYVLAHLRAGTLPEQIRIWRDGRCGRCGRKLTVPESVSSGLGPECSGRIAHANKSQQHLQLEVT